MGDRDRLALYPLLWSASVAASAHGRARTAWRGFLTTEPNAVVAPIHPKAMPVILTTLAEVDLWLLADTPKALELQRPLPDDALRIVASSKKEDGARQDAAPSRDQEPILPL
jgi:putative SOS response-associated peptidase YedK